MVSRAVARHAPLRLDPGLCVHAKNGVLQILYARTTHGLVCVLCGGGEPACVLWLGCGGPEAHFESVIIHISPRCAASVYALKSRTLCGTGVQYALRLYCLGVREL